MFTWDVCVIGAGPGGMQAAIAASSEGLRTVVLERAKVGGQIGQTPLLENSVFSAGGMTGPQFADMMRKQAEAMGATIRQGEAIDLTEDKGTKGVLLKDGAFIKAHVVILAMGNKWTELNIPGMRPLVGNRVHIGPVNSIAYDSRGADVMVYGGGPSAGQAVLALGNSPKVGRVYHVMRSGFRMPQYLVDRIKAHPRVVVFEDTILGRVQDKRTHATVILDPSVMYFDVDAIFMCNGLTPATEWLQGSGVQRDDNGHVVTRDLETAIPGVFAIGDCRAGSTPRVGVAIGDGSLAVTKAWAYFKDRPVCHICGSVFPAPKAVASA